MVLERKRLSLHEYLCELSDGAKCYYSPPSGKQLTYPCIIYDLSDPSVKHADNIPYFIDLRWTVTIVDEDPDSKLASKFFTLKKCRFSRKFASDDLNHFVFELYF